MKNLVPKLFTACLVLGLTLSAGVAHAQLQVVSTVPDLAAIAHSLGGDRVTVRTLALPTQDPHFVDPKPSLALALSHADVLLLVGLELERGWLPTLLTGARNGDIQPGARGYVDCSAFVRKLDVPHAPVDRSMGDVHPRGSPHYLYDPRAAAAVARGIAQRFATLDPSHAAAYEARLDAFLRELDAVRAKLETRLQPQRGARIVGYHRTWSYLADWLGLEVVGFVEPKPGIPPNAAHVAQLLALGRSKGVKAILQETFYPDATASVLAERMPAALVKLPGGTDFARGQSYPRFIAGLVERVAAALEGKRGG